MIKKNIFANIISRIWGFVSVYLFIPLYLKFLGIDAFGLVGFYSTLVGVLSFTGAGFTATLNREMARLSVRNNSAREMKDLLRTYECSYLVISAMLATGVYSIAPYIAHHWIHSRVLRPHEVTAALRLMGVALAFQLPSGLFIGGLMGLQKQVRANSLQVVWGVFRGVGAVLILWLVSPTIFAFAWWQLLSNGVYCLAARWNLWSELSKISDSVKPHFKWQVFEQTWRYATGMAAVAVVSTLLTQVDKLAISKMLPLAMLGYYTIAWTLSSGPMTLASPIASAVFPQITGLVALNDRNRMARLYHRSCELVSVVIIPVGLCLALFSHDIIFAWTGSSVTARQAGVVAALLIGGGVVQAILSVPYHLALAHGNVRLILANNVIFVVLFVPLLVFSIPHYGIVGAGFSWLVLNVVMLPVYLFLIHRRFLPGELGRWYLRSLVIPLAVSLPVVLAGHALVPETHSRLLIVLVFALVCGLAVLSCGLSLSETRQVLKQGFNRVIGVFYAAR